MEKLIAKIKTAAEKSRLFPIGTNICTVALSGGADSVALLHAMLELREEFGVTVNACHLNHNLRGEESLRDENFVRELCRGLGVELFTESIDVESLKRKHESTEEAARNARYEFFGKIAGLSPGTRIATAHTASDNAETVLLNLIRGTGLKGLCGIPPVRGAIVRPLILCERGDVEEFCRLRDLQFVNDSTNSNEEYTRNRLRLSVLPVIRDLNPSFDAAVTRMCEALQCDSDYLEGLAEEISVRAVAELRTLEKPLLTRIIMRLLSHNNIPPSNLRVGQVLGLIESGSGKINLAKHKFAVVNDGVLEIQTIYQNYR